MISNGWQIEKYVLIKIEEIKEELLSIENNIELLSQFDLMFNNNLSSEIDGSSIKNITLLTSIFYDDPIIKSMITQLQIDVLKRDQFLKEVTPSNKKVILLNGSGGLLSTTDDYLKFSFMLLNNGLYNEKQIIKKETLDLMKEDHSLGLKYKKLAFGKKKGFGLGFEVVKEDGTKFGSKGTFGWGGMFGTYFRVDPKENMVFIYMTQSFETYKLKLADKFRALVYQSIIK